MSVNHGNTGPLLDVIAILDQWSTWSSKSLYFRRVRLSCGHVVSQSGYKRPIRNGKYANADIRNTTAHRKVRCHICAMNHENVEGADSIMTNSTHKVHECGIHCNGEVVCSRSGEPVDTAYAMLVEEMQSHLSSMTPHVKNRRASILMEQSLVALRDKYQECIELRSKLATSEARFGWLTQEEFNKRGTPVLHKLERTREDTRGKFIAFTHLICVSPWLCDSAFFADTPEAAVDAAILASKDKNDNVEREDCSGE